MIFIVNIIHSQILFNKSVKNISDIKEKVEAINITQSNLVPRINMLMPIQNFLKSKNENVKDTNSEITLPVKTLIGYFTITHYDVCEKCCDKDVSHPEYGITSTGVRATPYKTIAVDPSIIPYGTKVIINGIEYVAEDTGGAIKGHKIDICVASHAEALERGKITNVPVYIIEEST